MAKQRNIQAGDLGYDDQLWSVLDGAISQLEDAWGTSSDAELAHFVPSADQPYRRWVLGELIKIDQEYRWESGEKKRVEEYLFDWPELAGNSAVIVELLEAECLTRAVLGDAPTSDELRSRLPELAGRIDLTAVRDRAEMEFVTRRVGASPARDVDTRNGTSGSTPSQSRNPSPLEAGRRFGRYEVRALLGHGGMGTLYQAYDTRLHIEVALKIPHSASDTAAQERFAWEARHLAKVRHRNVCPIYDVGEIDGTYYISMALITGQSLRERLNDCPLAPRKTAELVQKTAMALQAAHSANVVHRDIKPSNVMIDESGEPLLMDFGLARQAEDDVQLASAVPLVGTLPYMSPEQIAGRPADNLSDVYSLGVMFYELLAGKCPFGGPPRQLLASITGSEPPALRELCPELDVELEAICRKAMAKDPAHRYQSARDMAEALAQYLKSTSQAAAPRPARRWLGWSVAAVVLFASTSLLYFKTGEGTLELVLKDRDARILIDGKSVQLESTQAAVPIPVAVGTHQLEVARKDGAIHSEFFTIRWRGDRSRRIIAIPPGICGSVWNDLNGDGDWSREQEPALVGWKVYLDENGNGYWDPTERSQLTDAVGYYYFRDLSPETHTVSEVLPDGWEQTHPSSLVYDTDFSSDPVWTTNTPDAFRWDLTDETFSIGATNIDHGGHFAYRELPSNNGSFRLEWDIQILSQDVGSGIWVGMLDDDLNVTESGSYACVMFGRESEASVTSLACQGSNDEHRGTPARKSYARNAWYHVVMEYDSARGTLVADMFMRETGEPFVSLSVSDVGPFAPSMKRVGASNLREGAYQFPGARSDVKLDNIAFSLKGACSQQVTLAHDARTREVRFGNRELTEIRGTNWHDLNADGIRRAEEPGLEGWRIYLDVNLNGRWDQTEPCAMTEATGEYCLTGLSTGMYVVAREGKDDWRQTHPASYEWAAYEGHLYAVTKSHGTWTDCELEAQGAGGHLATVNDSAENEWLAQNFAGHYLREHQGDPTAGAVWIGLRRHNGAWSWTNGEPVVYMASWWFKGVPLKSPHTDYAYLHTASHPSPGTWYNTAFVTFNDCPRGIIELDNETPRPAAHTVALTPGESLVQLDFGATPTSNGGK